MKIIPTLSLLVVGAVLSITLSNQELVVKNIDSLHLDADASAVIPEHHKKNFKRQSNFNKPTFMQVEKMNQHELPTQARIGYLLSRGF